MEDKVYIKDFLDYSKWLIAGWFLGLIIGKIFDHHFSFGNPFFEGATRVIVGYGDTVGTSLAIIIYRFKHKRKSKAEAFLIGATIGSLAGPLVHFIIIRMGLNPLGVAGAIYAIAYSNADNWGGVISSLIKQLKKLDYLSLLMNYTKINLLLQISLFLYSLLYWLYLLGYMVLLQLVILLRQ